MSRDARARRIASSEAAGGCGWADGHSAVPRSASLKSSFASSLGPPPIFRPWLGGRPIGCADQMWPGSIAAWARSKNGSIQPCTVAAYDSPSASRALAATRAGSARVGVARVGIARPASRACSAPARGRPRVGAGSASQAAGGSSRAGRACRVPPATRRGGRRRRSRVRRAQRQRPARAGVVAGAASRGARRAARRPSARCGSRRGPAGRSAGVPRSAR